MALTKIDDRGLKTPIDLLDNEKIRFGTGNDLEIFHDGSNSYIKDAGTGRLKLQSDVFKVENAAGTENQISAFEDGAVNLYYDNSKKFETTSAGVKVLGGLFVEGTYPRIALTDTDNNSDFSIYNADGAFMIYDDTNSANRFTINSSGVGSFNNGLEVESYVNLTDNSKVQLGNSQDLQIYHTGSHSEIADSGTGDLRILTSKLKVLNNPASANELMIQATENGNVELYYDGSKKLETASYGTYVSGTSKADNFGVNDAGKYYVGSGNDLQIYHDGTNSYIKNTTNDLILWDDSRIRFRTPSFMVNNDNNDENLLIATENGAVEAYYDGSKKLETTSGGINVVGAITQNGAAIGGGEWTKLNSGTYSGVTTNVDLFTNLNTYSGYTRFKVTYYYKTASAGELYMRVYKNNEWKTSHYKLREARWGTGNSHTTGNHDSRENWRISDNGSEKEHEGFFEVFKPESPYAMVRGECYGRFGTDSVDDNIITYHHGWHHDGTQAVRGFRLYKFSGSQTDVEWQLWGQK